MKFWQVAALCVFLYTVNAKPGNLDDIYGKLEDDSKDPDVQNDDEDFSNYGDPEDAELPPDTSDTDNLQEAKPKIESKNSTQQKSPGETVLLPCNVRDLGTFVLIWKKENEILFQGKTKFSQNHKNLDILNNYSLKISNATDQDSGTYSCSILISSKEEDNPSIQQKLVINENNRVKIVSLASLDNKQEFNVGETLTLTCKATGSPKPKISWHKDSEKMDIIGETLTISELKPRHSGNYRCLADNGNSVAHGHIKIQIKHKPHVEIDKYLVNSDKDSKAELKCTVHAFPSAKVVWKKDGENVQSSGNIKFDNRPEHHSYMLVIERMSEDDFGTYSCNAYNNLGSVVKNISLVKFPAIIEHRPEKVGKDVVLTFKIESKSPISEHHLQYRKQGDDTWTDAKPEVTNGENDIYTIKYTLKNLSHGSYETRVRSQNSHGWSPFSDIFKFEGAKHHKQHKKHKEPKEHEQEPAQQTNVERTEAIGASQIAGSSTLSSSAILISIALLSLFSSRQ